MTGVYTLWVTKKLDPFHLSITFANTVRFQWFFHCCRQKLSARKHVIDFPTSPIVCCCTTLKNATVYTSSQKLLNKSPMYAVIWLLLQSRKFSWYLLLMLLHDVIMIGQGRSPPRPLLAVPNVTAHPSTASVPTSCYSMQHFGVQRVKG